MLEFYRYKLCHKRVFSRDVLRVTINDEIKTVPHSLFTPGDFVSTPGPDSGNVFSIRLQDSHLFFLLAVP